MRVWHATLNGHYVGGHAIVFADTRERALELLRPAIAEHGLSKVWDIRELPLKEGAVVLDDGDY